MMFHLPSFLLGYAAGFATGIVVPRLRPVAVEVLAAMHRFVDDVAARVATVREDLEDVVAEARARARGGAVDASASPLTPQASA